MHVHFRLLSQARHVCFRFREHFRAIRISPSSRAAQSELFIVRGFEEGRVQFGAAPVLVSSRLVSVCSLRFARVSDRICSVACRAVDALFASAPAASVCVRVVPRSAPTRFSDARVQSCAARCLTARTHRRCFASLASALLFSGNSIAPPFSSRFSLAVIYSVVSRATSRSPIRSRTLEFAGIIQRQSMHNQIWKGAKSIPSIEYGT